MKRLFYTQEKKAIFLTKKKQTKKKQQKQQKQKQKQTNVKAIKASASEMI